jgi:hypothetical protein
VSQLCCSIVIVDNVKYRSDIYIKLRLDVQSLN